MDYPFEVEIKQVSNGYTYEIKGPHKLGGKFVCKNTEEMEMLERIGNAVCGYKVKVERK